MYTHNPPEQFSLLTSSVSGGASARIFSTYSAIVVRPLSSLDRSA
jgi:hypothetical protein